MHSQVTEERVCDGPLDYVTRCVCVSHQIDSFVQTLHVCIHCCSSCEVHMSSPCAVRTDSIVSPAFITCTSFSTLQHIQLRKSSLNKTMHISIVLNHWHLSLGELQGQKSRLSWQQWGSRLRETGRTGMRRHLQQRRRAWSSLTVGIVQCLL